MRRHRGNEAIDAGASRTPDAHVAQVAHARDRFEVAACLDTRADDRQGRRILVRQPLDGHRGHGGRARFGDETSVHQRQQRAGVRIEQHDGGEMRRHIPFGIALENSDELGAECGPGRHVRRHQAVETARFADLQHGPDRLRDAAGGKVGERDLHRFDEIVHRQQRLHIVFVEHDRHTTDCIDSSRDGSNPDN